jgi:hypothetical protein
LEYFKGLSSAFNSLDLNFNSLGKKFNSFSSGLYDKLTGVLNMQSLNGSNGSKFKDGEKVKIEGYFDFWEVLGSYLVLTDDNVVTVVYQLKCDDRIVLAPASFVSKV